MGRIIHLGQVLKIKVRIDLRRTDVRVSEQFLDAAQILTGLQQMRGERMAEHVRMYVSGDALRASPGADP